jgi:uncharacterized protein YrrD
MRKRKDIQGLGVMDVTGGNRLGSVEDVVVSPDNGRILALTLAGGMLGGSHSFVGIDDVRTIGADAVTVTGDNVARRDTEMSEELRGAYDASRSLVGKKVVTESGTLVGTVSDFLIDESARRVTGLSVAGSGLLAAEDAISADRVVSVGPDAVIVTDEADAAGAAAGGARSPWASG